MANVPINDADGSKRYVKATGAGTDIDPFVPEHSVKQSAHDNLNLNANMQVGNADVAGGNPVPVSLASLPSLPAGNNSIGNVDVDSIAYGENHIGQVSGHAAILTLTLSLDTNPYADGDVLADTQAIGSAARVDAGVIEIESLVVLDEDDQGQPLDLVFLDANGSLGTENDAVAITDINARLIVGIVQIASGDWIDLGDCKLATKRDLHLLVKANASGTTLYVGAISRGTGTYTASGIQLRLGVKQF